MNSETIFWEGSPAPASKWNLPFPVYADHPFRTGDEKGAGFHPPPKELFRDLMQTRQLVFPLLQKLVDWSRRIDAAPPG